MPKKRSIEEKLDALIDAIGDSIFEASDEEILEDFLSNGIDIEAETVHLKTIMLDVVEVFRKQTLETARKAYEREVKQIENKRYSIPSSAQERRELFLFVTQSKQLEQYVTTQYRNLEDLTDNDIESYLQDLAELGLLEMIDHDKTNEHE